MNLKAQGWLAVAVTVGFFFALGGESPAKKNWDNTITNISVSDSESAVVITLKGKNRPTYTAFKLNDPARIVLDLAQTDVSAVAAPVQVGNGFVSQVTASGIHFTIGVTS